LDLVHLAQRGFDVVGVEFSTLAIEEFMEEQQFQYEVDALNEDLEKYTVLRKSETQLGDITLYRGDFFCGAMGKALAKHQISCIYDRASIIALNPPDRTSYSKTLFELLPVGGKILTISVEYEQTLMSGPPWCVSEAELKRLYPGCIYENLDVSDQTHELLGRKGKWEALSSFFERTVVLTKEK
jgi:thiopurine S-methyltransferase